MLHSVRHHGRFFTALACGLAAFGAGWILGRPAPEPTLIGGDVFYAVFLTLCLVMIGRDQTDLKGRAKREDEGILVVILITLATIGFFCLAVFEALSQDILKVTALTMAGGGALMGWFVLHTIMAFHYADLFYFDDPQTPVDEGHDLDFPGCEEPGVWDFLYFSFVIGMTCQVSDVQVKSAAMRRTVLAHGVVSFFFNTVFIAMAVNAGVSLAN